MARPHLQRHCLCYLLSTVFNATVMLFSFMVKWRRQKRNGREMQIRCDRWDARLNSTDSREGVLKNYSWKVCVCVISDEKFLQHSRTFFQMSFTRALNSAIRWGSVRCIQIKTMIMRPNLIYHKIGSESAFLSLSHFRAQAFRWSEACCCNDVSIDRLILYFKWHNKLFHYKYNIPFHLDGERE